MEERVAWTHQACLENLRCCARGRKHPKPSPVRDAVGFGELRAPHRVLLELEIHAIRVLAPALPCLVAAQFLRRHLHAVFDQFFAHRVNVIHLQAEMVDALAADFRRRTGLENFNELARCDLQIKAKQLAVLEKTKCRFNPSAPQ